jgi:hypothetical protein
VLAVKQLLSSSSRQEGVHSKLGAEKGHQDEGAREVLPLQLMVTIARCQLKGGEQHAEQQQKQQR